MSLLAELLLEGMFVVKNKDGKEKRFKDASSAEAVAWKNSSTAKKAKPTAYSQEWWEAKESDYDYEGPLPWTKINSGLNDSDLSYEKLKKLGDFSDIEDFQVSSRGTKEVDGVKVATAKVRVQVIHDLKDMGYDEKTIKDSGANDDGRVLDAVYIQVRRDAKNPKKIVFDNYVG